MPPRPRSPRPRPNPARRPRVAGMAPTAPRPEGAAHPSEQPDTTMAAPAPADAPPRGRGPARNGTPRPGAAPTAPQGDATATGQPAARPRPKRAPAAPRDSGPGGTATAEAAPAPAPAEPAGASVADHPPSTGTAAEREATPATEARRKPSRPRPTASRPDEADTDGSADDTAAVPIVDAAAAVDDEADGNAAGAGDRGVKAVLRRRAVPLLAAALVVFATVAVVAGIQDARLRGSPAAVNTALVDVGTTAEVAGQLSDAIETVYSFDFARLDENQNAAREVITPEFAAQFDRLFAEVRAQAPAQQAVVSATVTFTAVKEITGDRAVMVAFVDQQATRAAPGAESQQLAAAGRLTVTGERVDGRWKIAGVTPL